MRDVFLGFLILRLIALCALLAAGAGVLALSALARGSHVVGGVLLVAAVLFAGATAWLVTHRASSTGSS